MIPILNHLAYLNELGCKQTGSHSSNECMKLFYFDCGCVVTAQKSPDIVGLYRHHTASCPSHVELRSHNYTFRQIQTLIDCKDRVILVDEHKCLLCEFLELNYYRLNPSNMDVVPISELDFAAIANLPLDETHTIIGGSGNITVIKRIS